GWRLPRAGMHRMCQTTSEVAFEVDRLARIGLARVAEADPSTPAQHELLAPQRDFGLAVGGYERAVRAVIDEHEAVAPPFDASVQPRREAVVDHDVVLRVASERERRLGLVEHDLACAVANAKPRARDGHAGRKRRE